MKDFFRGLIILPIFLGIPTGIGKLVNYFLKIHENELSLDLALGYITLALLGFAWFLGFAWRTEIGEKNETTKN